MAGGWTYLVDRPGLLALVGFFAITNLLVNVEAGRGLFHARYLRRYFELRPGAKKVFAAWMFPVTAARLADGIMEEQNQLLALIERSMP